METNKKVKEFFQKYWTAEDFQGHPDLNCVELDRLPQEIVKLMAVVEDDSYSPGGALSPGKYVFPGDDFITWYY